MPTARRVLAALASVLLVAGCGGDDRSAGPTGSSESPPPSQVVPSTTPAPTAAPPTGSPAAVGPPPPLALSPIAGGLDSPLDIAWRPDDPDTIFVAEQLGAIRVVRGGAVLPEPFLEIGGIVSAGGERGLLGLAFHPEPADPRFFIYYTALDGQQIVASYRTSADDPDRADPDSATILLRMDDPFGNHNGGGLAFGPDGYLYVATGDGGGAGDPLDSGQRLDTLLAKVLRLDVNVDAGADPPYAIPPDNPFVATDGARPEIWLTGLRNPWRIRFDRATGDLWIGDVGQGRIEEIDVARAGVGGLDFGWNIMEGTSCYQDAGAGCVTAGLTQPVTEYAHDEGSCSVTGGTVYRGTQEPAMTGYYVFADYCSGRFWVTEAAGDAFREPIPALNSGRSISAIAEDAAGELFATDLAGGELLQVVVN